MSGDEKGYNGWSNYETWCVNLWMGNDDSASCYWSDYADQIWKSAEDPGSRGHLTREERARIDFADALKEEHEEAMPDLGGMVWADLLGAALSEVNWYEIAGHWISDAAEVAESKA